MDELFVSYELALLAKEKGFDEPCFNRYDENKKLMNDGYYSYSRPAVNRGVLAEYPAAPLYQQMIDYFRFRGIVISIYNNASGYLWDMAKSNGGTHIAGSGFSGPNESGCWDQYYDALSAALIRAFDKIKEL